MNKDQEIAELKKYHLGNMMNHLESLAEAKNLYRLRPDSGKLLHDRIVKRIGNDLRLHLTVVARLDDDGAMYCEGFLGRVIHLERGELDRSEFSFAGMAEALVAQQIDEYAATWERDWK